MVTEKDRLLLDIINDVREDLSDEQMEKLKISLFQRLLPLDVKPTEANIVPYEQTNERFIQLWLASKKMDCCSPRTIDVYRQSAYAFDAFIKKPFQIVTAFELKVYLAKIAERSSAVNANNHRRNLSAFFSWMHDMDIVPKNPIRLTGKLKEKKKQVMPFTEGDMEKLRYGARNDIRLRCLIEFLLSTGCRVSEVTNIKVKDVDWAQSEVKVLGKGNKERIVFINQSAQLYLTKYLESRNDNSPYLFVTKDEPHDRLKVPGIEQMIRNLGRSVGVDKVHPHRFRHTTATWAMRRGMPVELVQKMLGHNNIDTTMIYATTDVESLRAARRKYCN